MRETESHLEENLDSVLEVKKRSLEQQSPSQRRVEGISRVIGRPMYLLVLLGIASLWVCVNQWLRFSGMTAFDPFPYPLLDGILSLAALVSTTVVLIAQTRQSRLEQQHTHIGLQVNLLTEQKVTKLIQLIEELRRDLPMVKDRVDPQIAPMTKQANAAEIHTAIAKAGIAEESASDVVKNKQKDTEDRSAVSTATNTSGSAPK